MKKFKFLICIFSAILLTYTTVPVTAHAKSNTTISSNSNINQEKEAEIRTNLSKYGVELKTQDKLIKKLQQGKPWDSLTMSNDDKQVQSEWALTASSNW